MRKSFYEYYEIQETKFMLERSDTPMKVICETKEISDDVKFHIENNLSLSNTIYRYGSQKYYQLVNEVRNLYEKGILELNPHDEFFVKSELGCEAVHNGKKVILDSPQRSSGPKKYQVYVNSGRKNKDGEIVAKKVTFGDRSLSVKNYSDARRRSFLARHKCSQKKDRKTPGYWSCNVGRYAKKLGLSSSKRW